MAEFDVVELPDTDHVEVGETAPDFTRPLVADEFWEDVALSELTAGGPVLLVFYPMDGGILSPYIWNEIRDRGWAGFDAATVVGVSVSTPYAHRRFVEDRDVDVALYSDPAAGVARRYGVENDLDGMAGVVEHRPATVLVDADRTVRFAWVCHEWPTFPPYDAVESAVEEL